MLLPGYLANMRDKIIYDTRRTREDSHFKLPVAMFLAGFRPFYTPRLNEHVAYKRGVAGPPKNGDSK